MKRIKQLDSDVVHKIAAGEIIISPANALKEIIENSLDAGATSIDVVVRDGGFKLLQVTDDGHGVHFDDLPLLCERFATSKITTFNDLSSVETLGFRGEALASISHIAHLGVKTKTADSEVAIKASYSSGKLLETKKTAGLTGTQIIVEDLFYNVPLRQRALRPRASDEYQKILDVVSRYGIQYDCTFSCKRHGDSQPVVVGGSNRIERIRKVYGSTVANSLQTLVVPSHPAIGLDGIDGMVTGLNFTSKKSTPFIFFINSRLVSCEPLSRAIRKLYQQYLPKGSHAFVYMSVRITPANLDVNIHPTKREVQFLYEPEIIAEVCNSLEKILTEGDSSRDFAVQSYISSTTVPKPIPDIQQVTMTPSVQGTKSGPATSNNQQYEYKLVRTDPRQQTLTSLARPSSAYQASQLRERTQSSNNINTTNMTHGDLTSQKEQPGIDNEGIQPPEETRAEQTEQAEQAEHKIRRDIRLGTVRTLRQRIQKTADPRLTQLFTDHTLVGLVDKLKGLAAIQYDVRLYLIDYFAMSQRLFYQLALIDFANFGTIDLGDGVSVSELLKVVDPTEKVSAKMLAMAPMLEDYFRITMKEKDGEWMLSQIPLVLYGYSPPISRIPQFIADLNAVSYDDELACFDGILKAIASLHIPTAKTDDAGISLLFDTVKTCFIAPGTLMPAVVEIASLPGLYKVFERC